MKTLMKARVYVSLKPTVLDPQGQTIRGALAGLGHSAISDVRQGKYFEISLAPGTDQSDGWIVRNRPHSLGHPRASYRGERASASRLQRRYRCGSQRNRRKLSLAEGAVAERGTRFSNRDGHGSYRAPDREALHRQSGRSLSPCRT